MNGKTYGWFFFFLVLVWLSGSTVPLMDNDAAHHANIALHMYLSGDYVNLIDNSKDYLDKPHLHFWLAAFSYKIFGVTAFAYRFPSLLFSLLGIYSVYRLCRLLQDQDRARLAALIYACSFGFLLSLQDVRMDALLLAFISFSCWQLIEMIEGRKWIAVPLAALGLAAGFSTKGLIGLLVPLLFLFWYLLNEKKWKALWNARSVIMALLFLVFILPVLYCYYQQFNLHPEKTVRGRDHIDGIRFILFGQVAERYGGGISHDSGGDRFFFLHTFLWVFAPWSLIAYLAVFREIRNKKRWYLSATLASLAALVGFAGSKLPHYVNIAFPFGALLCADHIYSDIKRKYLRTLLFILTGIVLMAAIFVNGVLFPVPHGWVYLVFIILFFTISGTLGKWKETFLPVRYAASSMIVLFVLLNVYFYPGLLRYQGGQELAEKTKGNTDPAHVYFWKDNYSSSYCFAAKTLRKEFSEAVLDSNTRIIYAIGFEKAIEAAGYRLTDKIEVKDFEITKMDRAFADPRTREAHCSRLVMARISSM